VVSVFFECWSLFVPGSQEAAEDDELAEMVGGVVGYEESFAEEVLAVSPPEWLEEIGFGIFDEGDKTFEVTVDSFDGVVPGVVVGRLRVPGPVVVGPLDGVIAARRWRGEAEDVALGDAEMLKELPGGVGEVGWNGGTEVGGEVLDGVVEGGVGLATFKQRDELLAQWCVLVGGVTGLM
jgi:hypothetical protein